MRTKTVTVSDFVFVYNVTFRRWYSIRTKTVKVQSILVISKSTGLSEILRDIRTSTNQICIIEKK